VFILKFEFPSLFTRQATRNGYFVVLDLLEHRMLAFVISLPRMLAFVISLPMMQQ
jgi:hypothetical protein